MESKLKLKPRENTSDAKSRAAALEDTSPLERMEMRRAEIGVFVESHCFIYLSSDTLV